MLEWVAIPSLGDLLNPGIEPGSPALQADSLPTALSGRPTTGSMIMHYLPVLFLSFDDVLSLIVSLVCVHPSCSWAHVMLHHTQVTLAPSSPAEGTALEIALRLTLQPWGDPLLPFFMPSAINPHQDFLSIYTESYP